MVTIKKYMNALLHPAGGHQGSHKAHQAGNQRTWTFFNVVSYVFVGYQMVVRIVIIDVPTPQASIFTVFGTHHHDPKQEER